MPARRYYHRRLPKTTPQQYVPTAPLSSWRDYLPTWRDVFWYIVRTLGAAAASHFAAALVKDLALGYQEGQELWKALSDQDFEVIPESIPDIEGYRYIPRSASELSDFWDTS